MIIKRTDSENSHNSLRSREQVITEVARLTEHEHPIDVDRQLRRLAIAIKNLQGKFGLLFGVCNDQKEQRRLVERLRHADTKLILQEVAIEAKSKDWLDDLLTLQVEGDALVVYGLHHLMPTDDITLQDQTLLDLQLQREAFRHVARPLLIWMPEYAYTLIGQRAVDFWSWQSGAFFFESSTPVDVHNFRDPELTLAANTFERESGLNRATLLPAEHKHVSENWQDLIVRREREELLVLDALRAKSGRVIIVGPGGVGKSSLARAVAMRAEGDFVDRVFFLTANRDVVESMSYVISELAPTLEIPSDDVGLTVLYRSILERRRILLIIDDIQDSVQLRRLAPPSPSCLIATSRQPFELPNFDIVNLEPLPISQAVQMLRRLRADKFANESDLVELARQSGGVPLVLQIMAGFLFSRKSANELLRAFGTKDFGPKSETLRTSLNIIISRIIGQDQELFTVLKSTSIFEGSFDDAAVDSVSEIHALSVTSKKLEELVFQGLLFRSDDGRYKTHVLIRDYVLELLESEILKQLKLNFALFYQKRLDGLDAAYAEGNDEAISALHQFDLDQENIMAAQKWTFENSSSSGRCKELLISYAISGASILPLKLTLEAYRNWLEQGMEAATDTGATRAKAEIMLRIASVFVRQGELQRASESLDMCLKLADAANDTQLRAAVLHNMGVISQRSGRLDLAESLFRESLSLNERLGNDHGIGSVLENLGNIKFQQGDLTSANYLYAKSAEVFHNVGDIVAEARLLGSIASILAALGDLSSAINAALASLAKCREIGADSSTMQILRTLGSLYADQGELRRASELLEEAVGIANRLGDPRALGATLGNLAFVSAGQGKFSEAIRYAERSLEIAQQIGDKREAARQLISLGSLSTARGDYESAMSQAVEANRLFELMGDAEGIVAARRVLSEISKLREP